MAIRLYVEGNLAAGMAVPASADQAHYLGRVMRLAPGDSVVLFNGRDGEWRARLDHLGKRDAALVPEERLRPQPPAAGPWLAFAPVKKTGTDFIVQKSTELGAQHLIPLRTANSQTERLNLDRLTATAVEAAEQCERLDVPEVSDLTDLAALLDAWPADRTLYFLDETGGGAPLAAAVTEGRAGFLVGPEGGFQAAEIAQVSARPFVRRVTLGPRILRAETACLAALAVWQSLAGDWK